MVAELGSQLPQFSSGVVAGNLPAYVRLWGVLSIATLERSRGRAE
jgi:hypothetical protein